jgi:hypothetical protein
MIVLKVGRPLILAGGKFKSGAKRAHSNTLRESARPCVKGCIPQVVDVSKKRPACRGPTPHGARSSTTSYDCTLFQRSGCQITADD